MISDDGQAIVKIVLGQLDSGVCVPPTEMSLGALSQLSGITPQNIGMAFDPYICQPLAKAGILAIKCGSPVRIQLRSL